MVFERAGFAGRHRSDKRVDLGFRQIGELFEQGGGHLFALLFFPRPDPVDLVDQPLPRIVNEKRFVVLVGPLVGSFIGVHSTGNNLITEQSTFFLSRQRRIVVRHQLLVRQHLCVTAVKIFLKIKKARLKTRWSRHGYIQLAVRRVMDAIIERQREVRLVIKEILVSDDRIVIRHSIPLPTGPSGSHDPSPIGGYSSSTSGKSYLLRSGRERAALRGPLVRRADPSRLPSPRP